MYFLKTIIFTALISTQVYADNSAISYQDAAKFYKQTKTVEGTVVGTYCNEKMCFLNFDKDFRKYLSAVILATDFAKFSKDTATIKDTLDKTYVGQKVQVTGMLNEYKSKETDTTGRPQIALTDKNNIKVITK